LEAPNKEYSLNFQQIAPSIVDKPDVVEKLASGLVPIDWSLKSRLRFLCESNIPGNNLKTNQEASGLTSFVRCIDLKESSGGLDISFGARFHQSTHYWQHPHLPWLTLFPRNTKANNGFTVGEAESQCLIKDWTNSFRNLFQLVRARQCPYFYVCANTFTVIFRAAGVGGKCEVHALLSPTTRGMRGALKQEDIEFTMPLKKSSENSLCNDSGTSSKSPNNSFINSEATEPQNDDDDDDDMDDDKWLESLGVEAAEIKRINANHDRKVAVKECEDDFSDQSLVLIEGVECQAFFNFLLNCKSTTSKVGRLGGIPPTLLAPVAFQGATLKNLSIRSSKVRMDSEDYHSMELKGVILPHILPHLSNLLTETKERFSATLSTVSSTIVFCQASKKIIEDINKENEQSVSDHVFGRENLSDCGLTPKIVESMCRVNKDAIDMVEMLRYNKEGGGFIWE
jgi:protein downstream neighbor of Son